MMSSMKSWSSAGLIVLLLGSAARGAQGQARLDLVKADAVLTDRFSLIKGVRELRDGRLLVTDWIEERVALVDFARNVVRDQGRVGAGPEEFRLPSALHAFRGDSTILVDVGNSRVAVLDDEGRIARTYQPGEPAARSPGGGDVNGRLYFTIPQWLSESPLADDSVELALWDETGQKRVLARVKGSTMVRGPAPMPRVPFVMFARQDSWAVSANGRVAIVRGSDYHVEWLDGARMVRGPANTYEERRVTGADRTAYVRSFSQGSGMSGRGPGGSIGHTPAEHQTPEAIERVVRASSFAEVMPPFRAGDVRIAPGGTLWVGLWTHPDESRAYDVFDAAGRRTGTVRLRPDRQILAVGERHVYVVATDEDGLQALERYRIPADLAR